VHTCYMKELQYKIALSLIPKIGPTLVRRLVAYTGSIESVFRERKRNLAKIPGIGEIKASQIDTDKLLKEAELEIEYIQKENIRTLFYLDKDYPVRLRECEDAPVVLYIRGKLCYDATKIISIVGTRSATEYGRSCTEEIVFYLAERYPDIAVISGLAYGIDITAHKAALKNNVCTVAALGHGFEFMYPAYHRSIAKKITEMGALITEFKSTQKPEPGNFVSRNRIIAGLADATVVIESAEKGGALITADLANSYNREVFAFPGRGIDTYSRGCNSLIKMNKAGLVECGADIEFAMGWYKEKKRPATIQKALFVKLTGEEEKILDYLDAHGDSALDEISFSLQIPVAKTSASLLSMEFNGLVRPLPGKYFRKN
jgi:DNA processing protein